MHVCTLKPYLVQETYVKHARKYNTIGHGMNCMFVEDGGHNTLHACTPVHTDTQVHM